MVSSSGPLRRIWLSRWPILRVAHKARQGFKDVLAAAAVACKALLGEIEDLRLAVDHALQLYIYKTSTFVTPDHDDLRTTEQVRQGVGIQVVNGDVAEIELQVGQHGCADLFIESGDGFVQALTGQHVAAGAGMALGQRVKKEGVDVKADTKGEQAHIGGHAALEIGQDAVAFGDAFGGQTVGHEDDVSGALVVGHVGGFGEGAVDVGAADGELLVHPAHGFIGLIGGAQFIRVALDASAEGDDVEAVFVIEVAQDEAQGFLGLLKFAVPVHATGFVEHQDNVFGEGVRLHVRAGGQQSHKEAVAVLVAGITVAQQVEGFGLPNGVVQCKIAVGFDVKIFVAGADVVGAFVDHVDAVGGRIGSADIFIGMHIDADADVLQRLYGEFLGVEGIDVFDEAALGGEGLAVFQVRCGVPRPGGWGRSRL